MFDVHPILDRTEPWASRDEPLAAYLLRNAAAIERGGAVTEKGLTTLAALSFAELAGGDLPSGLAALGLLHRALDALREGGSMNSAARLSGRLTREACDALGWGQKGVPVLVRTDLPRDATLRLLRMGFNVRLIERLPDGVTPEVAAAATEGIVIRNAEDVAILEGA